MREGEKMKHEGIVSSPGCLGVNPGILGNFALNSSWSTLFVDAEVRCLQLTIGIYSHDKMSSSGRNLDPFSTAHRQYSKSTDPHSHRGISYR